MRRLCFLSQDPFSCWTSWFVRFHTGEGGSGRGSGGMSGRDGHIHSGLWVEVQACVHTRQECGIFQGLLPVCPVSSSAHAVLVKVSDVVFSFPWASFDYICGCVFSLRVWSDPAVTEGASILSWRRRWVGSQISQRATPASASGLELQSGKLRLHFSWLSDFTQFVRTG